MARTVSPRELKTILHDGGESALLDVREAGQFGESHLLFATPTPYSTLEADVARLVPRRSTRIVLCDEDGAGAAVLAATRLQAAGYTDVALLAGGNRGWAAAGYGLFKGVNVPSKLFGELVEHEYHTPRVTVHELVRMKEAGENFVIVDGRPFSEYTKMNIPGGICCPNAELPYRIREIVKDPATRIIVNCAGRTRSIMGAQTLINFGVANPVYALENGTQGWVLADFQLERGATRRYPERVDEAQLPGLQATARALMERHAVPAVAASEVERWLTDSARTTVLLDVRTPEEFDAGSLPGAMHAPGGQLVQATDQWVAVRNARLVLIDGEGVRAPVVGSWLKQLGCDVHVLEGGIRARVAAKPPAKPALPDVQAVTAVELKRMLDGGACAAFDLGPSMSFRKAHVPGSRWSIRSRLPADARNASGAVVLVTADPDVARIAAIDLVESGISAVKRLDGGLAAWEKAGYPTEASPAVPADAECIDYLFFVHDRHAGNREAMKQYLAWETGLLAQLDAQDRASFRITAGH
jgi:rhodanese-related sulfurtransferase